MNRISIIGTAGRKEDAPKLNLQLFNKMEEAVEKSLNTIEPNIQERVLVSGGAAYADHVAVRLFLQGKAAKLILHLPSKFDAKNSVFYGNKSGFTSNFYHIEMQKKTQINSLKEISEAIEKGAIVTCWDGFFQRNDWVAKSPYIIALTFNNANFPKDGGTKHTWDQATTKNKYHIDIGSL